MRIILNPMARSGRGRRLRPHIERTLDRYGVAFDVVQTEGVGHATELARTAANSGIERVVAAGGDGTIHEVANGLLEAATPATLGLIPIGTGNDFVKMVPGTRTTEQALATLANGTTGRYDAGRVQWKEGSRFFINAMGTGIDVDVIRNLRPSRVLPGPLQYMRALMRALAAYRPLALSVDIDGRQMTQHIMTFVVCNGPSFGGSFRICPDARPDDAVFDVCMIEQLPLQRIVRLVPRVLSGTHPGQHGVRMLRGASVRFRNVDGAPLFFQLDGELRSTADGAAGVEITLEPGRLNVMRGTTDAIAATGG